MSQQQTQEELEIQQKIQIESLERLRRNKDYQYLCTEFNKAKNLADGLIYDESTSDEDRKTLVIKSNIIKHFLELPTDILEQLES